MPEEKPEVEETPAPAGADSVNSADLDKLRQELGVYKSQAETAQKELERFQTRWEDREDQYRRDYSRQGQELGERVKRLQDLVDGVLQPAEKLRQSKKRPMAVSVPDNITEQEQFKEFLRSQVDTVYALQDEIERLRESAGGQNVDDLRKELKRVNDEINLVRYEQFLSKEEQDLKDKYGLSDRDLSRIKGKMQESGYYSAKSAAMLIPEIEEKMMSYFAEKRNNGHANGREEEPAEEKRPPKPRAKSDQVGQEMLKTEQDKIPRGGGKKPESESVTWVEEAKHAIKDGSFWNWPQAKQDEYRQKIINLAAHGEGTHY